MQYRKLPHGDEQISVIGLGMGSIHEDTESGIEETVNYAIANGINFFDMAASEARPYSCYARAFAGRRDKIYLQMHFGAVYTDGKYGWTRDIIKIKDAFESQLGTLNTDYADMGFVHCIDEFDDFDDVMTNGLWDYMKGLRQDGVIRHLGLSSHDPRIMLKFIETGLVDMAMFSINPAYDYSMGDEYALGSSAERGSLYRECLKAGVGISVMKPFCGGQLLDAATSPFKRALTKTQCIQYALDRPSVLTVLPGIRNLDDLKAVLKYFEATANERDYSIINEFTPATAEGVCVYCNHCQPCPIGLNVGLINKYYDLARSGDILAKGHYDKLSIKASSCIKCGHCEARCPFHVKQETRMDEISAYFEK